MSCIVCVLHVWFVTGRGLYPALEGALSTLLQTNVYTRTLTHFYSVLQSQLNFDLSCLQCFLEIDQKRDKFANKI